MKEIPSEIEKTFKSIRKEQQGCVELKIIKNSYCVRRATSIWDKKRKKVRKITEHLGVIALDGTFKRKIPRRGIRETTREIFEYGNGLLAHYMLRDVEEILSRSTPYSTELVTYAVIKAIDPKPIRLLSSRWEKLYLSKEMDVSLSPRNISFVLRRVGAEVSLWYELFSKLMGEGDIILYDLTAILTYSETIKTAEKGRNRDHSYLNQIGVVLAFSTHTNLPVGVEVFPGSMRDITTIQDFQKRFPKKDFGFIFDKGFSSYTLLDDLREDRTHYLVPLKKNSVYMDPRWLRWKGPFVYRGRHVLWAKKKSDYGVTYFFDDPKVRGDQETALLKSVKKGTITLEEFEEKRKLAGIIGIISDLDRDGEDIYDLYKSREDVELAFDALNNAIDSDKTYLRTEEGVRGYYFVSFIALRIYFGILRRLREKELTSKISVEEVMFELSKVMKIREKNGKEYFAKIPKKARKIMDIFPEVFYK